MLRILACTLTMREWTYSDEIVPEHPSVSIEKLECRFEDYIALRIIPPRVTLRITIRATREIADLDVARDVVRTNAIDVTKEWQTIECFARDVDPLAGIRRRDVIPCNVTACNSIGESIFR